MQGFLLPRSRRLQESVLEKVTKVWRSVTSVLSLGRYSMGGGALSTVLEMEGKRRLVERRS